MEGFGSGMAVGFGSGMAVGIGFGSSGDKNKKIRTNLRELVTDGRIRITDHRGNPVTVDELMELVSPRKKKKS